jgi:tRNA pseudouridine13 synthase
VSAAPEGIERAAGTASGDLIEAPARVARLTEDLPGLGGRIRQVPEDFRVEEIPLYEPAGEGVHVLFQVEKTGISTFEALLWISKAAKVSEHAIGYAGLKDAHAVTRQVLSVHRVPPERLLAMRHPRIRVLSAARHPTKIRIGHLKGNRFTIRIRGADLRHLKAARTALGHLCERGVPNAYGVQRFGVKMDGHLLGRALVRGDFAGFLSHLCGRPHPREGDPRVLLAREAYDRGDVRDAFEKFPMKHRVQKKALAALLRTGDPRDAFAALGRRPRRIYVSAYQSWLFNRCLDARVAAGTHDRLLSGDLAWLHQSGALYPVRDADLEEARALRFEASPTGPLPGYDLRRPEGAPGALEESVLAAEETTDAAYRAEHVRTRGARRPYRVPLLDASLEPETPDSVVARFALPPGAFATTVLEELMKPERRPRAPEAAGLEAEPLEVDEPGEETVGDVRQEG